MVKNKIRFY